MTREEAIRWIRLDIEMMKFDPSTGEEAYLNDDAKKTIEAFNMAIEALSLQPTCNQLATDCISRQDAIDATWEEPSYTDLWNVLTEVRDRLKALLSAQPKVIRCKDCRYWEELMSGKGHCIDMYGFGRWWKDSDFCSYAERRTDEAD